MPKMMPHCVFQLWEDGGVPLLMPHSVLGQILRQPPGIWSREVSLRGQLAPLYLLMTFSSFHLCFSLLYTLIYDCITKDRLLQARGIEMVEEHLLCRREHELAHQPDFTHPSYPSLLSLYPTIFYMTLIGLHSDNGWCHFAALMMDGGATVNSTSVPKEIIAASVPAEIWNRV